jgi:hypothetical protein
MNVYRDSFFRIFASDFRGVLQRFFENRNARITREIAAEFVDSVLLDKLVAFQVVEYQPETGDYHLDDRVERFFDEMLGAAELVQADWLVSLLDELARLIDGYQKIDARKGEVLLRRICRVLRTCLSRVQRHLEDIKAAADYEYRAGSDYEIKLMKLQWHLDRSRSYGNAIADLNTLLRNDTFFQVHQETELLSLRGRLIHTCSRVGDALIDVYQCIEEYLNRVLRDYSRARKLIRLRGILERHEHLTSTNLAELAVRADGPWFRDFRIRTVLDVRSLDTRPELISRALARAGLGAARKTRRVELVAHESENLPPIIDWTNVFEVFVNQDKDLFTFLGTIQIEGRHLTQEERVDGYCAILSNEDWANVWHRRPFPLATHKEWQYAVITPST